MDVDNRSIIESERNYESSLFAHKRKIKTLFME